MSGESGLLYTSLRSLKAVLGQMEFPLAAAEEAESAFRDLIGFQQLGGEMQRGKVKTHAHMEERKKKKTTKKNTIIFFSGLFINPLATAVVVIVL